MKIRAWVEDPRFREIVPYSNEYSKIFSELHDFIRSHIVGVDIEHFGSTAVSNLAAKPMIDLLIIVDEKDLAEIKQELLTLGFHERDVWVGVDTPEKPYVCGSVMWKKNIYNVNVHVCRTNSPDHIRNIRFRDVLRNDADLRAQYEKIKVEAVKIVGKSPKEYNDYKSTFIIDVMDRHTTVDFSRK